MCLSTRHAFSRYRVAVGFARAYFGLSLSCKLSKLVRVDAGLRPVLFALCASRYMDEYNEDRCGYHGVGRTYVLIARGFGISCFRSFDRFAFRARSLERPRSSETLRCASWLRFILYRRGSAIRDDVKTRCQRTRTLQGPNAIQKTFSLCPSISHNQLSIYVFNISSIRLLRLVIINFSSITLHRLSYRGQVYRDTRNKTNAGRGAKAFDDFFKISSRGFSSS